MQRLGKMVTLVTLARQLLGGFGGWFHASLVHSRNWRSFMRERRQGAKAGRNEFSVLAARKSESEDFDQVMASMEKDSVVLYFLSGGCSHARYQFLFKD